MKIRYRIIVLLTLLFTFFLHKANAQQEVQYTQYMINPYVLNPATAGTENYFHAHAGFRSQWTGFQGAPMTGYVSAHAGLGKKQSRYGRHKNQRDNWSGIGAMFTSDHTGPISRNTLSVTYAYNFGIAQRGKMRVALGAGLGGKLYTYNPTNYLRNITDQGDAIIETVFNKIVPDLSAGIWLYNPNFYFGFSANQILNGSIGSEPVFQSGALSDRSKAERHYFWTAGVLINDENNEMEYIPSVVIKYIQPAPVNFDINFKIRYMKKYWAGISYRREDALALIIGGEIANALQLSYSIDFITSQISKGAATSNEIVIGYKINHSKNSSVCPDMFW